ncbi:unnamed protein product [Moneuplotes crassus]|uniref:Uncharacterized protein n=1 Tax=Euplotes crassus TaxID=5936 RepID=A0AAD1XK20_EUPCR|nr:unnamed protein product [Moneuplotes crassus]
MKNGKTIIINGEDVSTIGAGFRISRESKPETRLKPLLQIGSKQYLTKQRNYTISKRKNSVNSEYDDVCVSSRMPQRELKGEFMTRRKSRKSRKFVGNQYSSLMNYSNHKKESKSNSRLAKVCSSFEVERMKQREIESAIKRRYLMRINKSAAKLHDDEDLSWIKDCLETSEENASPSPPPRFKLNLVNRMGCISEKKYQIHKLLHKIFHEHKFGRKKLINKNWRQLAETPSTLDILKKKEKVNRKNLRKIRKLLQRRIKAQKSI